MMGAWRLPAMLGAGGRQAGRCNGDDLGQTAPDP